MKKNTVIFLSIIMTIAMISCMVFVAENEAEGSMELMAANIGLGDYVQLGTYYGEPILWRCVAFYKVDSNGNVDLTDTSKTYKSGYLPLMLSDKILCLKAFDAKGDVTTGSHGRGYTEDGVKGYYRQEYGSSFWDDSNIRCWLNSEASAGNVKWNCGNPPDEAHVYDGENEYDKEAGFLSNFTQSERNCIRAVSQYTTLNSCEYDNMSSYGSECHSFSGIADVVQNANTSAYKQKFTDKMFLMDVNQVHEVYENRNILANDYYIGSPTQECMDKSEYKKLDLKDSKKWDYWLRSPGADIDIFGNLVRIVYCGGGVDSVSTAGSSCSHGVRPAFFLNLSSEIYTMGRGSETSPYTLQYSSN